MFSIKITKKCEIFRMCRPNNLQGYQARNGQHHGHRVASHRRRQSLRSGPARRTNFTFLYVAIRRQRRLESEPQAWRRKLAHSKFGGQRGAGARTHYVCWIFNPPFDVTKRSGHFNFHCFNRLRYAANRVMHVREKPKKKNFLACRHRQFGAANRRC